MIIASSTECTSSDIPSILGRDDKTVKFTCTYCNAEFVSKNKLFQHLEVHGYNESNGSLKLRRVVILVGWIIPPDNILNNFTDECKSNENNIRETLFGTAIVGLDHIERFVFPALHAVDNSTTPDMLSDELKYSRPKGYTRASRSTNTSSYTVGLEKSTHGLCDVISFQGKRFFKQQISSEIDSQESKTPESLTEVEFDSSDEWIRLVNQFLPDHIRVFHRTCMPPEGFDFNTDNHSSQRLYEYMLPLKLVMPINVLAQFEASGKPTLAKHSSQLSQWKEYSLMEKEFPRDSPEGMARIDFFIRLKRVMKRFCEKGRRSFHNFSNEGTIPEDTVSRRRVDRMYHKEMVSFNDESWAVFSISGDDFLHGQIRKMICLSLAVMRGWLPEEYIIDALSSDYVLKVPSVPEYALYLAECKFSSWESKFEHLKVDPRRLDAKHPHVADIQQWRTKIQRHIYELSSLPEVNNSANVSAWLEDLEISCKTCLEEWKALKYAKNRNILLEYEDKYSGLGGDSDRKSGDRLDVVNTQHGKQGGLITSSTVFSSSTPEVYERVLQLLREADRGAWPLSSATRQRVIMEDTLVENGGQGGTFSVGCLPKHLSQPKGNQLFPELLKACFELEKRILPNRPPSGTIAINRHAQFKTHRDSGAGNGQSLSLIVALGDFAGGEIVVEGVAHDIRYNPLEFDGWGQRHSTLPFVGERYTLVYFTPLGVMEEDMWWWHK